MVQQTKMLTKMNNNSKSPITNWLILIMLGLFPNLLLAQQNTVKFNLLPLVSKTFAFEYEREIKPKMTVNASIAFRGKSSVPFKDRLENLIDDDKILQDATLSHFTFTPEFRFYTSRGSEGARGFYIGPFIKYGKYNIQSNYEFEVEGEAPENIPLDLDIKTWSAGFVIGSQFKLAKSVFMDLRILGPHYGRSNLNLVGKKTLTPEEQETLREELDGIGGDVIDVETEVNGEGASAKAKGPWAGIRVGLSIGYRF